MRNKKIRLFFLLVVTIFCIILTNQTRVYAALNGVSNVSFNPGYITDSEGGWAIAYPAMTVIGDGENTPDTGKEIGFALYNIPEKTGAKPTELYTGQSTVSVKIAANENALSDGTLNLVGIESTGASGEVAIRFLNDNNQELNVSKTGMSENIVVLSQKANKAFAKTYLTTNKNVKANEAYRTTIEWDITGVNPTNE